MVSSLTFVAPLALPGRAAFPVLSLWWCSIPPPLGGPGLSGGAWRPLLLGCGAFSAVCVFVFTRTCSYEHQI